MTSFLTSDVWFPVTETRPGVFTTGQSTGTWLFYNSGVIGLGGVNSSYAAFQLDPANAPVSGQGQLRVRLGLFTNAVAPAADFTVGLYAVTGLGGASNVVPTITTIGAAIASTTITAPAASIASGLAYSAAVAVPTSGTFGWYVLAGAASAAPAANSQTMVYAQLQRQFA